MENIWIRRRSLDKSGDTKQPNEKSLEDPPLAIEKEKRRMALKRRKKVSIVEQSVIVVQFQFRYHSLRYSYVGNPFPQSRLNAYFNWYSSISHHIRGICFLPTYVATCERGDSFHLSYTSLNSSDILVTLVLIPSFQDGRFWHSQSFHYSTNSWLTRESSRASSLFVDVKTSFSSLLPLAAGIRQFFQHPELRHEPHFYTNFFHRVPRILYKLFPGPPIPYCFLRSLGGRPSLFDPNYIKKRGESKQNFTGIITRRVYSLVSALTSNLKTQVFKRLYKQEFIITTWTYDAFLTILTSLLPPVV